MQFSKFAKRYTEHSGIVQLMEDLGEAMSGSGNMLMLGGGNPAHIPVMEAFFQERMQRLVQDPAEFSHFIGNYDPPKGEPRFIEALAELFNREYGWGIGPENIVLTAGSQSAFFLLFNMLAGEFPDGSFKRILLPLAPEYIGYGDVGLKDGYFVANRPDIETLPDHTFKYHVDFGALEIDESIGALCVSRPTNPTGNVLTDEEVSRLSDLSRERGVPLIIDNAYGMPFPNIIFTDASLYWDRHIILCMSLSKLGLPAARTGIIIANEEVVEAVAGMNGIFNLAMGSLGPTLALDLVRSGEVIRLSDTIIKPYYRRKAEFAIDCFRKQLDGVDYYIHKAEGAIFLWLWFPGLPISSEELYQRLKAKGVLVLSGHYFFPGIEGDWRHRDECIRVSYAMPDEVVSEGIRMIADEVKKAVSSK
jgi:valine--pyruvate aminotransferase